MNANTIVCWSSLLVLLVAAQQNLAKRPPVELCTINRARLTTHVLPENYHILIWLEADMVTFRGRSDISLWMREGKLRSINISTDPADDPRNIILHVDGLDVYSSTFIQEGRIIDLERICHDPTNQMMMFTLPSSDIHGYAHLDLLFRGNVKGEAKGLFKSVVDPEKVTLATHFKPHHARKMFPCFDEPEFRSTFELILKHPAGTIGVSNMEGKQQTLTDGTLVTKFNKTPQMSTYQLSLAVGQFGSITRTSSTYKTAITIYAPLGMADYASNFLKLAVQSYERLTDYFMTVLPAMKIDIVAVNNELGATGNLGLITMPWNLLSSYNVETRVNDHLLAFNALITQMALQQMPRFFTIRWWDELWIQEGIAAHLASILAVHVCKERSMRNYALVDTTFSAMNEDDKKPRAINDRHLTTPERFEASYDLFAYKKSAALMNMFVSFFGDYHFTKVLQNVIRQSIRKDSMVTADRWWQYYSKSTILSGKMKEISREWSENVGYPTIIAEFENHKLRLKQMPASANNQFWSVPIRYEFHEGNTRVDPGAVLLSDLEKELSMPDWFNIADKDHWFTLNCNYYGYYRVLYLSNTILEARHRAISLGRVPPADRIEIISESFTYCRRMNTFVQLEEFLSSFSKETDDGVVLLLTRILNELAHTRWSLTSSKLVTGIMLNYLKKDGRGRGSVETNQLNHYTRYQVIDYLMNRVRDPVAINEIHLMMARAS